MNILKYVFVVGSVLVMSISAQALPKKVDCKKNCFGEKCNSLTTEADAERCIAACQKAWTSGPARRAVKTCTEKRDALRLAAAGGAGGGAAGGGAGGGGGPAPIIARCQSMAAGAAFADPNLVRFEGVVWGPAGGPYGVRPLAGGAGQPIPAVGGYALPNPKRYVADNPIYDVNTGNAVPNQELDRLVANRAVGDPEATPAAGKAIFYVDNDSIVKCKE